MALPSKQQEHDHQTCDDEDCPRYPCRIYKEGFEAGEVLGRQRWLRRGVPRTYSAGYAAGVAAAAKG